VGRQRKGVLSGRDADAPSGLVVRVVDAVRELERHDAEAARWWRENAPHLIEPGKLFVYPEEACALVEEAEKPG